nr:PREDICTED: protein FAR1-RELATED SEQUENCE 5-like [Daucus carota subsp. sativus]
MENTSRNTEFQSNSDACSNTVFDHHRFDENFDFDVQELGRDWIPECSEGLKPYIDQRFSDLDQDFIFYKEYGRSSGFDIRWSTERSDRDGNTIEKYFVCSRSGRPDDKNVDKKTPKAEENGKGGMQFLRCSRSLTEFHKRFIFDASKSNVGASRAYTIVKSVIGSYEDLGATVVDFKNFPRDIKQHIGKHDTDMIVQKFRDIQESSDPNFKFEYKTDSANHLTQLFWADGEGKRNYEVFGDAVSFDATYRTNMYGMVFIPLIGIDNHWKSVTFGAILLEREDNENYIWACESFKKVFGKDPKCIITDQDLAMKAALQYSFPLVKHRLCFMDKLGRVIWVDHIMPEEFEQGWTYAVDEFDLNKNVWLKEMFDMRSLWIPSYFNDEPMVGLLRTTSRSESSNFYFGNYVQRGDTLSEFYICYQSAIEKQRNNAKKLTHYDDFTPKTITDREIEKDAIRLYTRALFYKVQEEIRAGSMDIVLLGMTCLDNVKKIKIQEPVNKTRIFEVAVNMDTHNIECSCKLFTRVGYLCSHAFFCLGICGIRIIPRQYVSNRWLKNAVERFSTLELGEISDRDATNLSRRVQTQDCWFEFQGCLSDASGNADILEYIKNGLCSMRKHITITMNKPRTRLNSKQIEELIDSRVVNEITIQNPNKSNNKGSRKRIISGAEKSIGCNKRKMRKCATCQEYAYHDSRTCPEKN